MSTNKISFIIIALLIVVFAGGLWWWYETTNPSSGMEGEIVDVREFNVDLNDRTFVAEIENADSARVVAIGEDEEELEIGTMIKGESRPGYERWTLPIPENPVAAEEIIVRARGVEEDNVDEMTLPIVGSKEIYNTLWLQVPFEEITLSVGEIYENEDISFKVIDIPEDSRCPVGVECVREGSVVADLEVEVNDRTSVISLRSGEGERQIGNYYLSLIDIMPQKEEGVTLTIGDYDLTFYLTKDIEKAL